jgi:membrane associated rhomboid family serine protease
MSITVWIIIVTCLVSISAFRNDRLMERFLFWPYFTKRKNEWWRFVTCGFIHADYMHLGFNMFTLYFFGRIAEIYIFGKAGFVLFYLLALIASNIYSYFRHRDNYDYRALGASGAVSTAVFSFIILAPWEKIIIFVLPVPAIIYGVFYLAYSAYSSRKGYDNIGHDAHFWGGVFGIVYTLLLRPDLASNFMEKLLTFHS